MLVLLFFFALFFLHTFLHIVFFPTRLDCCFFFLLSVIFFSVPFCMLIGSGSCAGFAFFLAFASLFLLDSAHVLCVIRVVVHVFTLVTDDQTN